MVLAPTVKPALMMMMMGVQGTYPATENLEHSGLVQVMIGTDGELHRLLTDAPAALNHTAKQTGIMTMWTTNAATTGGHCEYAKNGLTGSYLPRHIRTGYQCAIGNEFGKGEHCGKCYRVTSLSNNGNGGTPGKIGSAEVMVTDSGAGGSNHFDCVLDSFKDIAGASTGIFPIEYEEIKCTDIGGNPVITNWADQNAYYCKMMFHNIGGWGQLNAVKACLGSKCSDLQLFSGATWTGCPQGIGNQIDFTLTQKAPSGELEKITCTCERAWPWPTNTQCTCPKNFAGSGSPSPSPQPSPQPTPQPAPQPTPQPSPSPSPSQCSGSSDDCRSAGCCQDGSMSCYEKDEYWASCRASCTPGINPDDPVEFQSPWSCKLIGNSGSTPEPTPEPTPQPTPQPEPPQQGECSEVWKQCGGDGWAGPTCCTDSTCEKGSQWYSQCKPA